MFDQQLTFDGGAEDIAPAHEQPRMFNAPKTMRGQLPMPEPKPHVCEIRQDHIAGRGGWVECSCGWKSLWQPTCVEAAALAEDHQDYYA